MNYELKNAAKEIAGMYIFSLPWSDRFAPGSFKIVLPRSTGLDVSQMFPMDSETETISIALPPNKKILEIPASVNLTNDMLDFSMIPKLSGNILTLTRSFKIKKSYIPADKVAEFNDMFKKMVESDGREFAMK